MNIQMPLLYVKNIDTEMMNAGRCEGLAQTNNGQQRNALSGVNI